MSRSRVAALVVLLVLLAALVDSWARAVRTGLAGPVTSAEEGDIVTVSLFEVAWIRPPDHYGLRRNGRVLVVEGPTPGLVVGEEITVRGVVSEGHLVEQWRAVAPRRRAKKWLGGLGLLLTVGVAVATIRVTPRGLALRG